MEVEFTRNCFQQIEKKKSSLWISGTTWPKGGVEKSWSAAQVCMIHDRYYSTYANWTFPLYFMCFTFAKLAVASPRV